MGDELGSATDIDRLLVFRTVLPSHYLVSCCAMRNVLVGIAVLRNRRRKQRVFGAAQRFRRRR